MGGRNGLAFSAFDLLLRRARRRRGAFHRRCRDGAVSAGDNDIAHGLGAEEVAEDFKKFAHRIHEALPETGILYLSIKPSLARWDKWPVMDRANRLIEESTRTDDRLEFVDMTGTSLGPDGKPRPEFLQKDGLHLNEKGYQAWTAVLAPRLGAP